MRIIGVDPGAKGALCLFNTETHQIIVRDMPLVDGRLNPHELASIIDKWLVRPVDFAAIESVHAFPKMGVVASFKFGMGYGGLLAAFAMMKIQIVDATPSKWTADLRVGRDKDVHRRRAIETWPKYAHLFKLKKHDGRADAALIAYWAAQARLPA